MYLGVMSLGAYEWFRSTGTNSDMGRCGERVETSRSVIVGIIRARVAMDLHSQTSMYVL